MPQRPLALTLVCAALTLLGAGAVRSQSVALSGIFGNKALLVIDGTEPRAVATGDAHRGVKVVAIQGDTAVLEIGGQRQSARIGGAPVSVGKATPGGSGARIVLTADGAGHFVTQGTINSRIVQFLVDTGATTIGISMSDADRIGLSYRQGQAVQVGTANGIVRGWKISLSSVRLNDVEVYDIDAIVTPVALPYVLLGNSYLTRFQMTRTNEQMVLEKRF
ncbi:MAG: TIGR02281 family clan AA aspartic protease [Burkholderiaceae bacterium]